MTAPLPLPRSFGVDRAEASAALEAMDGPDYATLDDPTQCACGNLKEIDATVCEECR